VEGSCEHGNEPSGSTKCWELAASQEGLSSVKLVDMGGVAKVSKVDYMLSALKMEALYISEM
jgi:hypothetical protein